MRLLALALAALVLCGCETTAEKSAKLEREAARHGNQGSAAKDLSIARQSSSIEVLQSSLVRSSEGTAAIVTLRNLSPRALRDIPIAIAVHDSHGGSLYTNTAGGLVHSLQAVALLPAHGELSWVDDQVQGAGTPSGVSARVGEGTQLSGAPPSIAVAGAHLFKEATGSGVQGTVVNRSQVAQRELVVYGVARRGARIVAAGRAVLAELPAHASLPFQIFFVGDATGAALQLSAPPSTVP